MEEENDILKTVFANYSMADNLKYIITSNDNISKLINIFEINNSNDKNTKYKIEQIISVINYIKESFICYRINADIFNYHISLDNKNIYIIMIDFYLYNKYNSSVLDNTILSFIDILINNIDISKNIIDYILHKFSYYFYALDEKENKDNISKKDFFTKLLQLLIHILGVNYKQTDPKEYYYLTEDNCITIPIKEKMVNIGITLWLKYYFNGNKGQILTINLDLNNIIKLHFENNIFIISCNGNDFKVIEKEKNEKIFLSKEWNCLSFNYKSLKKKWMINFYLNNKQILKDFCINNKPEKDIYISSVTIGKNFFGEIGSIIITNNNDNLLNFKVYDNLNFFYPYGFIHYKYTKFYKEKFKELKSSTIYIYSPYGGKYNLINNLKNDLIFENSKNNNIHIFKSYFKKIYLLGGINIILPIIELFYINIDICVKHKNLIKLYFNLIFVILKKNRKNMLEAIDNYFFMILSIFIEKLPKELFDNDLLKEFIDLSKFIFSQNKFCTLYLDYFNYIILNENIFKNFSFELQIKLWEYVYDFFKKNHKIFCPINKIANILLNYDKKNLKGEEICCEEHYNCFIDEYKNIYKNKKISNPNFDTKTKKIFLLYERIILYTKEKGKNDRLKYLIELLSLNISPCFIIRILNLIQNIMSTKADDKKNIKDETFNLIKNNEEYKILIFNLLCHDYLDVKYAALSLILTIYEYMPKEFQISFEFIKDNILPSSKLSFFNYKNFSPSSEEISNISKYCVDIMNNLNTFNICNHDDIICTSIFNFSNIYINYTKFIYLFLSYLKNHEDNIYEILDILIYMNKNLNIDLTIELINNIKLYILSNSLLAKNIFTYIPLLNYFLDTMIYYLNISNYISSSIYNFIINMISILKEDKKKLVIIEYIIKYYSLLLNRGNISRNNNIMLYNNICNILNKFLTKISSAYINKDALNDNYQFISNLISILYNYALLFKQDKSLYIVYQTKKTNFVFPSFEDELSIMIFFLKGLKIESNFKNNNKTSPKLNDLWKDYSIFQKIFDILKDIFNVKIYIGDKQFNNIKDKIIFIYDNLINKNEILNNENIIKFKKILYYIENINKNFTLIKVFKDIFEIAIFLSKDTKEFEILINQYNDYILFIIVLSVRIFSENINNKKSETDSKINDNDIYIINKDVIFFSVIFLFDILSINPLINNNKDLRKKVINIFNQIMYLCFLIYQNGTNQQKKQLLNSPPFYFFQFFFIKDENEIKEKNNEQYLKDNIDKLDDIYDIIMKDVLMYERFYNYKRCYSNKFSKRYINSDIIINSAKNRLENDTVDYSHNYAKNIIYILDFDNFKEKSERIIQKIKKDLKDNLNNIYETLKIKRNYYKLLKKKLFMWNGVWSNLELFYKDKKMLKYKIYNHYTKSLLRPFLIPIIDINYYTPKFSKFDFSKLFNDNDIEKQKYKNVCLDIDKILNHMKDSDNNDIIDDYSFINNFGNVKIIEKDKEMKFECCLAKVTHHIRGLFFLTEQGFMFKVDRKYNYPHNKLKEKERLENDFYDDSKNTCFGSYFSEYPKDKDFLYIAISFNKISYIFKRLYYYNDIGLEIFTTSNKNYYLLFNNTEIRNDIYKILYSKIENKYNKRSLDSIINDWKNYSLSNLELLMWLNIYSDRSYNDLSQYPVLPWIISNYNSEKLNEKIFFDNYNPVLDESLYRDLNLSLGMIETNDNGIRKNEYINNFVNCTKLYSNINNTLKDNYALSEKPYNFGSHYSNPIYVNNFLSRLFPYSYILIEMQGDKFDDPDRLFINVSNSYNCSTTQKGDVRELIPEFYTIPEIYHNINNYDMGIRRNKEKVNNVKCPIWSRDDPYKFLSLINMALESDYVSLNINNWIDLIFGYKQRGKEGEKANNIYRFPSYADLVPINQMIKEEKVFFYRFAEFGICPRQIFKKPFEKRAKLKVYKEIIDKNNMVITLNINDDKKINENNKKIIGIFPLDKQNIKILFNDFSDIDFKKEKIKENVFRYEKVKFFYGHGLILNDDLLGNARLDIEKLPFVLYNNDQYLIEGGFINGEMVISDLVKIKGYLLFNDYDHSPVIEIKINKEENIGIVGNLLGNIYIYKVKEYFWDYKKKINIHNQKINSIFISDELNAFISSSNDNYVNIFSLPTCKVIHSLFVEEPEIALLSSRPLASCLIYSNKDRKLMIYSVNGHLVKEMEINQKPECPIIYTNKYFRDHLIFVKSGSIFIYSLPYLEIINKIQIIEETLYKEYDIFIKCYQNKTNNIENLIACDRNKYIIYIIGNN